MYTGDQMTIFKKSTYEEWLKGIRVEGRQLCHAPEEFKTLELCLEAIKYDGYDAIRYVPAKFKDLDFYLYAIKEDARALQYIPDNFRTPEFYFEALKQNAKAFLYIPNCLLTYELCLETLKYDPNMRDEIVRNVPEHIRVQIYRQEFVDSIKDKSVEELLTSDDSQTRELGIYIQGAR